MVRLKVVWDITVVSNPHMPAMNRLLKHQFKIHSNYLEIENSAHNKG